MSESQSAASAKKARHVPPGINNDVMPYLVVPGASQLIEFLIAAFEGTVELRVPRPDGSVMHAEVLIGDSMVEMADAAKDYPAQPATVHLYVANPDAAYARALQAGATSVYAVEDQPWGDRQGCVKDKFGNIWYVAMPKGWEPGPEGLRNVQPFLHLRGAEKMIPFAEAAFGAESLGVAKSDEGEILHATIRIGNGTFEIAEEIGEFKAAPCYLHVYVPDADASYAAALKAGGTGIDAPSDKGYGDHAGSLKDPFGNTWFVATHLGSSRTNN
jgi:PhnB protein